MIGSAIWNLIGDYVSAILMAVVAALACIIWCLIRAAVLILAWIMFALTLVFIIALFIVIVGLCILISSLANLELNLSINEVSILGALNFEFGYYIEMEYIEFFDLHVPLLKFNIAFGTLSLETKNSIFTQDVRINGVPEDLLGISSTQSSDSSSLSQKSLTLDDIAENEGSNEASEINESFIIFKIIMDFLAGMGLAMGLSGGFVATIGTIIYLLKDTVDESKKVLLLILSIIVFIASVVVFIIAAILMPDKFSSAFVYGMA